MAPLDGLIEGEVLSNRFDLGRYATDASIYQMMPLGVVVPKTEEDVIKTLEFARGLQMPLLPRGGGTSQCGQTVNTALVIDYSKHLNRILDLDIENQRCEWSGSMYWVASECFSVQ